MDALSKEPTRHANTLQSTCMLQRRLHAFNPGTTVCTQYKHRAPACMHDACTMHDGLCTTHASCMHAPTHGRMRAKGSVHLPVCAILKLAHVHEEAPHDVGVLALGAHVCILGHKEVKVKALHAALQQRQGGKDHRWTLRGWASH